MLKLLIKRQLAEVFKSYFYNAKKNKMRSKLSIVGMFILFIAIMVGLLGGIFTAMSVSLCRPLVQAQMGWLYFFVTGSVAIVLGAFGSIFNSYSGLYLSKDNDLLLSLPIPARTIITARLTNVYLMGAMYSATVLLPALIVYWVVAGPTVSRIICGILFFLIITVIVLVLSCLLGWVVARISVRLKNRSFVTVLLSLVFIGVYYFVYFKASDIIRTIIANAEVYGVKIKGAAYGLYLFGRVGEGDWLATLLFFAVTAVLFTIVWIFMSRSFLKIVSATGVTKKVRYTEKPVKQKSAFGALLGKEFARFTSNPNYMLNCGLPILLIPACGILLLIKGREFLSVIDNYLSSRPGSVAVLVCAVLCLVSAMNDMAVPSISLEGRSIWIPQSLPVLPKSVLRAKAAVQLILTGIPMLFAAICAAIVVQGSPLIKILICVMPLVYTVFSAMFSMTMGVKMPLLNWTNELAPIKQGGAIVIVMFGSWAISVAIGGLYLLIGYKIGPVLYLLLCSVVFAVIALILLRWLDTKGAETFKAL